MSEAEIIEALTPWVAQYYAIETAYAPLRDALMLPPENAISEILYETFERYTSALALIVGDHGGWLEWYCWENGMGAKALHASPSQGQALRPIDGLQALARVIV